MHGSDSAVHCAKLQNDLTAKSDVMDKQDFLKMCVRKSLGGGGGGGGGGIS